MSKNKQLFMKAILCFFFQLHLVMSVSAQQKNLGLFQDATDVGDPKLKGSVVYNPQTQEYPWKVPV
jgi:hypothetical protein